MDNNNQQCIGGDIVKSKTKSASATISAGCFWSVELAFQRLPGVLSTEVGYTNGQVANPTYNQVCTGTTGHTEAVKIEFNPEEISFGALLKTFWSVHDATTLNRQKNDIGTQYRSGIYTHSDSEKKMALASKEAAQAVFKHPIVTEIEEAGVWYPAEDYHQKYLEKGGQCSSKGCSDNIRCYG